MESKICANLYCKNPVFTAIDPNGDLYVDEQCGECLEVEMREEQNWIDQEQSDMECHCGNDYP